MQNARETDMSLFSFLHDQDLEGKIVELENSVAKAANNPAFDPVNDQGVSFTTTEIESITRIKVLKALNSPDLVPKLLQYKYVRYIHNGGMAMHKIRQYTSLAKIATAAESSVTELSRMICLVEIVLPYLVNKLHMDISSLWIEVGKSNFFDMLAVLKVLITSEKGARSAKAYAIAQRLLDDAIAVHRAAGQAIPDDEALRQEVVQDMIENAARLSNRELRTYLRSDQTSPITVYHYDYKGQGVLIALVNEEQKRMLTRKARAWIDVQQTDLAGVRKVVQKLGIL
jgi:transcriptional regulator of met regulon